MNKHFAVSLIKSLIRIVACYMGFYKIEYTLLGLAFAEILGIVEEIVDTRI